MAVNVVEAQQVQTQAQKQSVRGKVTDETGKPLQDVSITIKGSTKGVVTNEKGEYNIDVPETSTKILVFSFVGMEQQEIKIENQKEISITLKPAEKSEQEVVVVGYGTQRRKNLTGAIQKISGDEIVNRPASNVSSLLQGEATGITFSTPSSGYAPGNVPTIQIRSQAALNTATPPLIVIDGIPSTLDVFNNLNPNDIADFSILKDAAAAAIYGARAPYGVIIVTTKIGNKNKKPQVTLSANYGIVNPIRLPNSVDAYTYVLAKKQAFINDNIALSIPQIANWLANLALIKDNVDNPGKHTLDELVPGSGGLWNSPFYSYCNNNFIDVWMKKSARFDQTISIKGGNDKTDYYFSAGYVYQPGIFEFVEDKDNYKRINLNAAISSQVNNWLKLAYRTRIIYSRSLNPNIDGGVDRSQLYSYAYGSPPLGTIKNPDGTYNYGARIAQGVMNGAIQDDQYRFDNTLSFDIKPLKNWSIHVDGNWRMQLQDYQNHIKPVYQGMPNSTSFDYLVRDSSLTKISALSNYWTIQGYSSYETRINKHDLRFQLGAQIEELKFKSLTVGRSGLYDPNIPALAVSMNPVPLSATDALSDWATVGTFGRLNYGFNDKYLLEINARYDGSGRYSADKRWGLFSSAAAGWVISRESFWNALKGTISNAKLRLSYGTLGNQGNSPGYLYVPTIDIGLQSPWIFGTTRVPYAQTPSLINSDRTWEKITTLNGGLDLDLFKNRLHAGFDLFNRRSWDIIGPPEPIPSVFGATQPQVNNAEFVTKGYELMLSWKDNLTSQFNYGVSFSLSDAKSKITKYNTSVQIIGGANWYEGMEIGEIWGFKSNRLLNASDFDNTGKLIISQTAINSKWTPGDARYEDLNGDKAITIGSGTVSDHGDLVKIGNATPRYLYSVGLSAGYNFAEIGRFDISALFQGVGKIDIPPVSDGYYFWGARPEAALYTKAGVYKGDHLNFYRDQTSDPDVLAALGLNLNPKFPKPYGGNGGVKNFQSGNFYNSNYLINGAYIRLKSLQVSYTLPSQWLKKIKFQDCKIYFAGENLWTLTKVPEYMDPENYIINSNTGTTGIGATGRMYPQQAVYSFGINISF